MDLEIENLNVEEYEISNAIRLLYYWQYSRGRLNSFHDILYGLFQKADMGNLAKLKRGFPAEYIAWRLWNNSPSQDEFFKGRGFDPALMGRRENGPDSKDQRTD